GEAVQVGEAVGARVRLHGTILAPSAPIRVGRARAIAATLAMCHTVGGPGSGARPPQRRSEATPVAMNPGTTKRQREMARRQHQQEKSARKQQRQAEKAARLASVPEGEDPDLAGIVPGPQPLQDEWIDDVAEEAEEG